jgi:hypothetical protein
VRQNLLGELHLVRELEGETGEGPLKLETIKMSELAVSRSGSVSVNLSLCVSDMQEKRRIKGDETICNIVFRNFPDPFDKYQLPCRPTFNIQQCRQFFLSISLL